MRTADFQMIGQQLDFAFLSSLVKRKEEIVLNEFVEEEKMMQQEDVRSQAMRLKRAKESQVSSLKYVQLKQYSKKMLAYLKHMEESVSNYQQENKQLEVKMGLFKNLFCNLDLQSVKVSVPL